MLWYKKRDKKDIKDPLEKYGEILRNKKTPTTQEPRRRNLTDKSFQNGCDSGFVYYEE